MCTKQTLVVRCDTFFSGGGGGGGEGGRAGGSLSYGCSCHSMIHDLCLHNGVLSSSQMVPVYPSNCDELDSDDNDLDLQESGVRLVCISELYSPTRTQVLCPFSLHFLPSSPVYLPLILPYSNSHFSFTHM